MSNVDTKTLITSLNAWRDAYNPSDKRYDKTLVLTLESTVAVANIIRRMQELLLHPTNEWIFDVYTKANWDDGGMPLSTLLCTPSLTEASDFAEAVAAERKEPMYIVDSAVGEVLFAVYVEDPTSPYARIVPGEIE